MTDTLDTLHEENQPRPKFLTVLCILTFIATGFNLVAGLINLVITGKQSEEAMLEMKVQYAESISGLRDLGMLGLVEMMEKLDRMTTEINENFYMAAIISLLTVGIGLYAALKMWKGFKIGFHIYIVYNLLAIAGIYIYVSPGNIPSLLVIINVALSAIFVFMYSRNLHWMTK